MSKTEVDVPLSVVDIKQTMAHFAQERNELRDANDRLINQWWLLITYSFGITILCGWLVKKLLSQSNKIRENGNAQQQSKNAIITIRNGSTQKVDVIDRVKTRKSLSHKKIGDGVNDNPRIAGVPTSFSGAQCGSDKAQGAVEVLAKSAALKSAASVRVMHRTEPIGQDAVNPVTAASSHQAFSLLEVMISVAVLATVLLAMMSSFSTLRQVQRNAQDLARVEELTTALGERILGANWDWLGRSRPDEVVDDKIIAYKKGAWSWHRRQRGRFPGTQPSQGPLVEDATNPDDDIVQVGLLSEKTGISDLKVYLEYYRTELLQKIFMAGGGTAPYDTWNNLVLRDVTNTGEGAGGSSEETLPLDEYIMPEGQAMSLRDEAGGIVVRIVVTWKAVSGGQLCHELVFARRK